MHTLGLPHCVLSLLFSFLLLASNIHCKSVPQCIHDYERDGYAVLSESESDANGLSIFPRLTAARLNELRDLALRSPNVPKSLHSRQGQCQELGTGQWFPLDENHNAAKIGVNCGLKGNRLSYEFIDFLRLVRPELLEMSADGYALLKRLMQKNAKKNQQDRATRNRRRAEQDEEEEFEFELFNLELIITAPNLPPQPCHSDAGVYARLGDVVTLVMLTEDLVKDELTVVLNGSHLLPPGARKFPCDPINPVQPKLSRGGSMIYDGKTQHFGGSTLGLKRQRDYVWFAVFIRKDYEQKEDLSALVQSRREEESRLVQTTATHERLKRCKKLHKKLIAEGGVVDPRMHISEIAGYGLGYVSNFTSFEQVPLFTIPKQFVITAPDIIAHYPEWSDLQQEDSVIGLYLALTKFHPTALRKSSKKFSNREKELTISCLEESEAYSCGLMNARVVWHELRELQRYAALGVFYQSNQEPYETDYLVAQALYPQLTQEEFFFAVCLSLRNPLRLTSSIYIGYKAIMPLVSLINHSPSSPDAGLTFDKTKQQFVFSQRAIIGDQIFANYFVDEVTEVEDPMVSIMINHYWKFGFFDKGKMPVYFTEESFRRIGLKDEMKYWFLRDNIKNRFFWNQICRIGKNYLQMTQLFEVLSLPNGKFDSYTIRNILDRGLIPAENALPSMSVFGFLLQSYMQSYNTTLEQDWRRFDTLKYSDPILASALRLSIEYKRYIQEAFRFVQIKMLMQGPAKSSTGAEH